LLYDPIPLHELECAPHYNELAALNAEYPVVIVFGGGGNVWDRIYATLHTDIAGGKLGKPGDSEAFAMILRDVHDEKAVSRTWRLFKPGDLKGIPLRDPGRMMYWYAACTLLVGRGGLAAQQILATMLSDLPSAPGMLFVEEPKHPQIESERNALFAQRLIKTAFLEEFKNHPFETIKATLAKREEFAAMRERARLRYLPGMIDRLADLILAKYAPHRGHGIAAEGYDLGRPYSYALAFLDQARDILDLPGALEGELPRLQLEIHPPPDDPEKPCMYDCRHCYRKGLEYRVDNDVDTAAFQKVVLDFKGKVPRLVISGLYSDPACSKTTPDLIRAARKRMPQNVGVHTKLRGEWVDAILEAIFDGCEQGDYLTVSLDAGTARTYGAVTGDSTNEDENFKSVVEKLEKIGQMRDRDTGEGKSARLLRLNITYLLLDENQRTEDIQAAIEIAKRACADCIRFSLPQGPVGSDCSAKSSVSEEVASLIRRLAAAESGLSVLLMDHRHWTSDGFNYCYAQLFDPALGADGFFYPCCQVAASQFEHLRLGRVSSTDQNWDSWQQNSDRKKLIKRLVGKRLVMDNGCLGCRVCNRRDGAINTLVAGLLTSAS
jgi:hypothetical protein